MSLLIMSITVLSLLAAFSTAFAASATHRNLAVTDTVLRSVSEQVVAAFQQTSSPVYAGCPTATTSYYDSELASALTAPAPYSTSYTGTITALAYWSGSDFSLTPSTCTSGTTGPEQLTLEVVGPRGASESTVLVVSGVGQIVVAPSVQLAAPSITGLVAPSGSTGAISVSFSGSSNAPASQTYSARACVDAAMTMKCVTDTDFTSGATVSGLIAGTTYYVTIEADPSTGYLSATSPVASGESSGVSTSPTVSSVSPSTTTSGALVVTFVGLTNPPSGQTYSVDTCLDSAMSSGCVVVNSFTSGATVSGLTAGSAYYVTVTANADGAQPASTSVVASPAVRATQQLASPTSVVASSSPTTAGVVDATFTPPSNAPAGQTYQALACTNSSMTSGCVSASPFASGDQIVGLTPGTAYYVTVNAIASSGYLSSTSAPSNAALATTQLAAPTITSTASNASGSAAANYSDSTNAPASQTYTVTFCLDAAMTSGCVTSAQYVSGSNVYGLNSGASYYVTVSADASSGYLSATSKESTVNVS